MVEPLEPTDEPGTYMTDDPVPVAGDWKTLVRVSRGNTLSAMPIYLPEDPAIPAEGVPASASFERPFVADHEILQREQQDAAGWLTAFAYVTVALIALGLLALIAWALHRLAVVREAPGAPPKRLRSARRRRRGSGAVCRHDGRARADRGGAVPTPRRSRRSRLDAAVLPAGPADRGRLVVMRAIERRRNDPGDTS